MQLAICDDIQKEPETIRAALDTYAAVHPELHFVIDEYSAAIDVLNEAEKGKTYDIALLDICMPGLLGTNVAEEMLAKKPDMSIVFLTTGDEYAVTAFALNTTHYLRLNLSSGEILRLRMKLSQMFEELRKYSGFIKVGASYVVNLTLVRKLSGNTLEMLNGIKISIHRRSGEEAQRTYMDFCWREVLK